MDYTKITSTMVESMTIGDLHTLLKQHLKTLYELRVKNVMKSLKDTSQIAKFRSNIARIKYFISQKITHKWQ